MLEREAIYQRVWGYAMAHGDRSVDVFIRKLRQKLEKRSPGWSYIHTHFGVGYRFDPEPVGGIVEAPLEPAAGAVGARRRAAGFTGRSQAASRRGNRRRAGAPCSAAWRSGTGSSAQLAPGGWRSGPRSTPRWSTAGR